MEQYDAFLIIAGKEPTLDFAINSIINRIKNAKNGPLAETRAATPTNETIFLRPRPGASRMYPETDIPTIKVSNNELGNAISMIPKSWEETILQIQNKYKINEQLSEQIFDSEYFELFEKICKNDKASPNFVASVLCSTITNLQRNDFDASLLKDNEIFDTFNLLNDNKISKESIEIIFKQIMSGKAVSVSEAIQNASIKSLTEEELNKILDVIVEDIWVGGLARVKAQRIKEVICVIKARRGNLDLNFLADMPLAEAKSWLRELPGVGPKTAAVVLCFSLGMPSMPVDTHIYRVSRRLGLVDIGVSVDEAHDVLEAQIYPERVFPLHMYMINHGRQVCKARRPNCAVCILNRICPSAFSV